MPLLTDHKLKDFRLRHIDRYLPIKGLHWLVVSVSLVATMIAWQVSLHAVKERTQIKFDRQVDYAIDLFKQQMNRYADVLQSGVGLIATSENVSPDHWDQFTQRMKVEDQFPAFEGFGVVYRVDRSDLGNFVREQRLTRPDFKVRTPITLESVEGMHFMLPLTLISPRTLEKTALGLNVAREARRNDTIKRTISTGAVQITAPIRAAGIGNPGFVMMAPIFRTIDPATNALRETEFIGAVVAAVITEKLAVGIIDSAMRQVEIKVSDNSEILYNELVVNNEQLDPEPLLKGSRTVPLFGRDWSFELHSNKAFRLAQKNNTPSLILMGGLTIDVLLILLFLHMSRANQRATAYGRTISLMYEKQSEDLRQSNETLEDRNEQLESFSYVVSHDLKAPLRGIGFLASCIEEDMEDLKAGDPVPLEIEGYVGRIKKQVTLAQGLIHGVLQYSGLGTDDETPVLVDVRELLDSLRIMLTVEESQLQLVGEFPSFETYQTQLTQVFMNLISNAYKYHHGQGLAVVKVGIEQCPLDNFYRFSVSDNGPGIEPEYHQKIFEPFSTLQPKDHSMSSGVGLAIVKKLIALNGGTINVASEIGLGTRFTFDWPSSADKQTSEQAHLALPKAA